MKLWDLSTDGKMAKLQEKSHGDNSTKIEEI